MASLPANFQTTRQQRRRRLRQLGFFVLFLLAPALDLLRFDLHERQLWVLGQRLSLGIDDLLAGRATAAQTALTMLLRGLLPAVVHARANSRSDVNGTVAQNTIDTVKRLYQRSAILRQAVDEGRLVMLGLTYHLGDGRAEVVDVGPMKHVGRGSYLSGAKLPDGRRCTRATSEAIADALVRHGLATPRELPNQGLHID